MSKKVLIVSDSHGLNIHLEEAIANMGDDLDLMIHLGDSQCSEETIRQMVSCPVEMVKGNSDRVCSLPEYELVEIGSHKALLTHGHIQGGRWGIGAMKEMARENGADIVMFGHIHEPIVEIDPEITVLNPGSITLPRQEGRRPTYLVMTIEDDGRTDYSVVYL